MPATAAGDFGTPGGPGTTAGVGAEGALLPTPLIAVTLNVYAVPLTRLDTVSEVGGAPPAGSVTVVRTRAGVEVTR